MYNNYVKTSRSNAAANAAGSVASWMGQCLSQEGTVGGVTTAQTDGLAPITMTCTIPDGVDAGGAPKTKEISTMALPPHIKFTISNLTGAGTVAAVHSEGSDPATYAY